MAEDTRLMNETQVMAVFCDWCRALPVGSFSHPQGLLFGTMLAAALHAEPEPPIPHVDTEGEYIMAREPEDPLHVLRDTDAAGVLVSRQDAARLEAERQAILGVVGRYEILAARLCRFGPMPGPITSYHFREAGEELAAITADLRARLRAPALVSPAVPAQEES